MTPMTFDRSRTKPALTKGALGAASGWLAGGYRELSSTLDLLLPKRSTTVAAPVEMPEFPEKPACLPGWCFLTLASTRARSAPE